MARRSSALSLIRTERTRPRIAAAAALAAWLGLAAACSGGGGLDYRSPPSSSTAAASSAAVESGGADSGADDGDGDVEGGAEGGRGADGDSGKSANSDGVAGGDGGSGAEGGRGADGSSGGDGDAGDDGPDGGSGPDDAPAGPVAALTGQLTSDFSLAQRRALAVKVDNGGRRSRPQVGLAAADVVYEVLIEGGSTRFLAVFHSEIPGRIGPVRSARSSDVDLLADLGAPYLASSGANITVLRELRQAGNAGTLVDVGGLRTSAPYQRDRARRAPSNLFFHYADLDEEASAASVAPLFEYGSSNAPGAADAAGVTVTFHRSSGTVASHIWDADLGGWARIQRGTLHTAETDFGTTEVAPANVVVVWVSYQTSAADEESPQAVTHGSGDALVLTAGSVHQAVWERTEDRAGFRFADAAGNELRLSPGSTWVLIANTSRRFPVTKTALITASEGARLLAEARAAAEPAGNGASGS